MKKDCPVTAVYGNLVGTFVEWAENIGVGATEYSVAEQGLMQRFNQPRTRVVTGEAAHQRAWAARVMGEFAGDAARSTTGYG